MGVIKASGIYLRHPRVFSTFGVIGAIAGTIQDVFIEYASFGNLIALASIGLFVLIAIASVLGFDAIVKRKVGSDWPGVGLAATALFALLMAGTYYWSDNNQNSGGVLASNFDSVENFQSGIDAMMAELGVIKKDLEAIKAETQMIAEDTRAIRESSEEIKTTTSTIRDRIEKDPETILKDMNLTLTAKGYDSLLKRDYDADILYPVLEIFANHDFTLGMDASLLPGMMELWSSLTERYYGYWPDKFSVIGARLFKGDVDWPNLKKAFVWEVDQGIRKLKGTETVSFNMYQQVYNTCGKGAVKSCFSTHLARHRSRQDFLGASFTPAHWAALGGEVESLEWLASVNAPLNERNDAGYAPLDLAIEASHVAVAVWLLEKLDNQFEQPEGMTYEILALKAMDGVDTEIDASILYSDSPDKRQWHSELKARTEEHQRLMARAGKPSNSTAIAKRVQDLISPHYQRCVDTVSEGRERFAQSSTAAEVRKNREQFGFADVDALDRELTSAEKRLNVAVKSLEENANKEQELQKLIKTEQAKKREAERELARIEQARKTLNILSKEYRDTYDPERDAKVTIIRADGAISMAEYELENIRRSMPGVEKAISQWESKVADLSDKRRAMSEQPRVADPTPQPILDLASTCDAIKRHLDFVRDS